MRCVCRYVSDVYAGMCAVSTKGFGNEYEGVCAVSTKGFGNEYEGVCICCLLRRGACEGRLISAVW